MRTASVLLCLLLNLAGCASETAPPAAAPGEVVIDRYKGKGILLIATPSKEHPSYQKFVADGAKVEKLSREFEVTIIELVNGESGHVRGGQALDSQSIAHLVKEYVSDKSVMSVLLIGGNGKVEMEETGDVDVMEMLKKT